MEPRARVLPRGGVPLLTSRGWGLVAVAALLVVGWRVSGLRDVLDLAVLVAALPAVGVVWALATAASARPALGAGATTGTPSSGGGVGLVLDVCHRLPVAVPLDVLWAGDPSGRLVAVDEGGSPGPGPGAAAWTALIPGSSTRATRGRPRPHRLPLDVPRGAGLRRTVDLLARRRGPAGVSVVGVDVCEPLGLARVRLRARRPVEVLVLPALLEGVGMGDAVGFDAGARTTRGTGEPGGTLRDHRSGDPLRLLHWKQSARQGRLLVNVVEAPGGSRATVSLVTDAAAHTPSSFEEAVRVVATLAVGALARGDDVEVGIGPDGGDPRPVRSPMAVLRDLAVVEVGAVPAAGAHGPVSGVVVTGHLTASLVAAMTAGGSGTVVLTDDGGGATPPSRTPWSSGSGSGAASGSGANRPTSGGGPVPGWTWARLGRGGHGGGS